MLAIDRGQPRVFNLKEILQSFLDFRKEVVIRRTTFDLMKARERAHILEGLIIALDRIDEVIAVIKASANPQEAADRPLHTLRPDAKSRRRRSSTCASSA